ncbi:MAG: alpha/beta hydrolase [Bacteroidota bacterium]
MTPEIQTVDRFQYVERGEGPIIIVLHGLFGALSNFNSVLDEFSQSCRVIIPLIPLYQKGVKITLTIDGLTDFIEEFVAVKGLSAFSLLGNSLGGHVALAYTLRNPEKIETLILTGSSGLFETGMGVGFPRRSNYEFVEERVAYTFYSPNMATKDLVDEVYDIVNDNVKTLSVIKIARSAQRHNMSEEIHAIQAPTLLIWGLNDNITPPRVAHEFDKLIPNTELRFIDQCGHAPMMEQPEIFNKLMGQFLQKHLKVLTS